MLIANYDFDGPYSDRNSLRDEAGVYIVLNGYPNADVLDVGESQNIRTRLNNHEREPCWIRNNTRGISYAAHYMPNSTQIQRRAVESAIRRQYPPRC